MKHQFIGFSFLGVPLLILCLSGNSSFAHNWMAPQNEAKTRNPIHQSQNSINKGEMLFNDLCSYCHGMQAQGLETSETGLNKKTPNLLKRLRSHSDGDFHWKIRTGKGEMPPFESEVLNDEIWHIINYLKSMESH